jgi:peptidoglycan/xylan/chitin deacetylase (PgdA/CDA1 family)
LVTFDDGYVDNLVYGKPLLERFGVPAVVFVASGYVGSGRRFWWDELAEIFFGALRLPRVLRIAVEERQWEWVLDGGQGGSRVGVDKWHVESRYDPTPSHRAYRELHWLLRGLGRASREEVLNQLRAQTDGLERGDAECRPMTPEEVRWLVKGGLVNVGAHTVSHPVLARLPVEAQRFEIRQSKSDLESVVGRPVSCFAYPYGDRLSVGDVAVDLVREAGYTIGFGNFPGWVVGGRAQPWWYLPRWSVRDWDGEEFARRLEDFLG